MPDLILNGAEGRLEARYHPAKTDKAPIALLLHPHPQHGGTMHNKVVFALHQTFSRLGFTTLRFNFRGVGRSQGTYSRGEGELTDAAATLDWLQATHSNAPACWVAGFSFGAWIGMQLLMRRPEITRFISIAPPASAYDFGFLAPCPSSGLIIHGDKDELVPLEPVQRLAEKLNKQRDIVADLRVMKGAGHFFNDKLEKVSTIVEDYVRTAMREAPVERSTERRAASR